MTILIADYIYRQGMFEEGRAVAFDTHIRDIDTPETLIARHPDAELVRAPAHSVLFPGFINPHVHLEFSANLTTLRYGDFMSWLDSVIAHRDELVAKCDETTMQAALDEMLQSGVTSIGAISSFGRDMNVCATAAQRVVYFNELIGSSAQSADILWNDFLQRLEESEALKDDRFLPAVAVHAPYSVHPIVLRRGIEAAKTRKLPLSAHFLESLAERQWLEKADGPFKAFFERYFQTQTPVNDIASFMHAFDGYPTLFVHGVQATREELSYLASQGHRLAHCPRSNRYLGCGRLALEAMDEIGLSWCLATDGKSSNDSLNLFDEMRAALMLHHTIDLQHLANKLIAAVTYEGARALDLPCGTIEPNAYADLCLVTLPELPVRKEEIALWTVLHTQKAAQVYIGGERYV